MARLQCSSLPPSLPHLTVFSRSSDNLEDTNQGQGWASLGCLAIIKQGWGGSQASPPHLDPSPVVQWDDSTNFFWWLCAATAAPAVEPKGRTLARRDARSPLFTPELGDLQEENARFHIWAVAMRRSLSALSLSLSVSPRSFEKVAWQLVQ